MIFMQESLSAYSQALARIVAKHWPEQQTAAFFEPQLDLSLGDISSRLPTVLARALYGRPEVFSAQICELWQEQDLVPLHAERGFLNARIGWAQDQELHTEKAPVSVHTNFRVILPPPIEESDRLPTCRLGLRALFQLELMHKHNIQPTFEILGSGPLALPPGRGAVSAWIEVCRQLPLQRVSAVVNATEQELVQSRHGAVPSILWLLPATIPAKDFRRLFPRQEDSGQLRLAYVDAGWSHWPDSPMVWSTLLEQARSYSDELLYYLSGEIAGSDIDLAVPALAEKANPFRYARMTCERLSRLLGNTAAVESFSLNQNLNTIIHRVRYYRAFEYFAATAGNVAGYTQVFGEILDLVNAYCNQPAFRNRLAAGKANLVELKILTGVFKLLSDIIPTGHPQHQN